MIGLPLVAGLALDRWLGEPRRWHPLAGFGWLTERVEHWLRVPDQSPARQQLAGLAAWLVLVAAPVALLAWGLRYAGTVTTAAIAVAVLYGCLGWRSLAEHARAVAAPLAAGDLAGARQQVAMLVSRDTAPMDEEGVTRATVESVLENGNDAVLAPLFWFAVAGAPGVLGYRLANTLDACWGYRTPGYRYFGWAAARLDDGLNWVPARLCALGYGLAAARPAAALFCWRTQAADCESPNAGPVMAAGAGALGIRLGGEGLYHGQRQWRPQLGRGRDVVAADIERAVRLVTRTVVLWVLVIAGLELALRGGWGP